MSDLISRSKLLEELSNYENELRKDKVEAIETDDEYMLFAINNQETAICRIKRNIVNMPTAHDIDKVVSELKTDSSVKLYGSQNSDNYMIPVNKAIEIVKHGGDGTGTEAETIRDKAVKWNNNSTKKVPYEFIEFVEGKREIGVSDDVCEWKLDGVYLHSPHKPLVSCVTDENYRYYYCPYCGKKIKVVE